MSYFNPTKYLINNFVSRPLDSKISTHWVQDKLVFCISLPINNRRTYQNFFMGKPFFLLAGLLFLGCTKEINCHNKSKTVSEEGAINKGGFPKPIDYNNFTIRQGQHYCDQNGLKSVRTSEMKFMVKFDKSAIYQTLVPENQYDINKLWGFTEGINNQYNSARIGWSWNNNALRLYGYVHANGIRHFQEMVQANCPLCIRRYKKESANLRTLKHIVAFKASIGEGLGRLLNRATKLGQLEP